MIELYPRPGSDLEGNQGSIAQRLARLDAQARQLLQGAAIAGRRFTAAEVAAAVGRTSEDLTPALLTLGGRTGWIRTGSEILWPDGTPTRRFEFCSDLVLSSVRETVPESAQSALNLRIARRLAAAWGSGAPEIAARLAVHFERAGDFMNAVKYLSEAGASARRLGATVVALDAFRSARALLGRQPNSNRHGLQEAELCTAIGRELVLQEGLRSAEAEAMYRRAWDLQRLESADPGVSRVLWRLWVFHINRGPLSTTRQIATKLHAIARDAGDPTLLLQSHHALWGTSLMEGRVNSVLEHTAAGMSLCGSRTDGSLALTTGCTLHDVHMSDHHTATCAGFFAAWAEMLAGRTTAGMRSVDAAVSHARDVRHPFTLAVTLVMGAGALAAGGEPGLTKQRAEEGMTIAEQEGFAAIQAWACIYLGWALTREGDAHAGLSLLRQGLEAIGASGMTLFRPFQLSLAADAELRCGFVEEATRCIEEGLSVADWVGDGLATAELHRLRAEVAMHALEDSAACLKAEADLIRAREIANEQGASLVGARVGESWGRLQVTRLNRN